MHTLRQCPLPQVHHDVLLLTHRATVHGPEVTNIDLQRQCPQDNSDHLAISFDANALRDVLAALDPARPMLNGNGCDVTTRYLKCEWT
jgi:hypothetical protein